MAAESAFFGLAQGEPVAVSGQPTAGVGSVGRSSAINVFEARFMRLLERQMAIYTMGDSTSVPTHVAADLVRSVCFVLGIDPEDPEVPERLLGVDLEAEFRSSIAAVERKVHLSATLWRDAVAAMPPIPSTALRDTLAAIGDFPRQYDHRSMAHDIPVVFDYPLCHPVPESLLGVDYINEYLRRLRVEFDFIGRLERDACIRVLELSSPDYVDLLLNMYEPVAANAIGRAVAGEDPRALVTTGHGRVEVIRALTPLDEAGRSGALHSAVSAVCAALGLDAPEAQRYLHALVPELLPRIEVGLSHDLRGVFV